MLVAHYSVRAQKSGLITRYWNHLVNDTTELYKAEFLAYPTLAYSPETSWELGVSSVFVFYARRDTTNRLSEVNGFTFFTLENQYGLWFDHALYSHQNRWFTLGRMRFQSYPIRYHGIGIYTPGEHIADVNANQLQIKERVLRKVYKSFYAGIEADYQRLSSVEFIPNQNATLDYPTGSNGSANFGIGAGILYDNRHNILNVRHGFFSELAILNYHHFWGSDHSFKTIISDTRYYHSINKRDVLAFQAYGQFNAGDTPFNQLALLGGETIMRGYYLGRFRDKNLVAAQVEYRMLPLPLGFTNRWGAAVFASTGTVSGSLGALSKKNMLWAAGGGVRFLIFQKKDIFTRLDVAFTREGTGIYIFIGEAF